MTWFLYALAGVLYIIGLTFIVPIFFGVIAPIPSMPAVNRLLIRQIKEKDTSSGDILDIGSGYGFTVFALAKAFPKRRIVACEISCFPLWFSMAGAFLLRRKNITFLRTNGFVYAGQHPEVSSAFFYFPVTKKVRASLSEMARTYHGLLFSNTYAWDDKPVVDVFPARDLFKSRLYVYDLGSDPIDVHKKA